MGWDAEGDLSRKGSVSWGSKSRQIHPRRQSPSRWKLAKCYFLPYALVLNRLGNGLGYVSPFRVSVSSFLASSASSGFCRKSIAVRAMILAA